MKTLTDEQYQRLTRVVYRDLIIDTLGNLALGLGLYLAFSSPASWPAWLLSPYAKAVLIATGIINLRYFFIRIQRLQIWQAARQDRQNR